MQSGERVTPWVCVFAMSQEGRAAACLPKGTGQRDGLNPVFLEAIWHRSDLLISALPGSCPLEEHSVMLTSEMTSGDHTLSSRTLALLPLPVAPGTGPA